MLSTSVGNYCLRLDNIILMSALKRLMLEFVGKYPLLHFIIVSGAQTGSDFDKANDYLKQD